MIKLIIKELSHHAPYTFCGALSGILVFWFMGAVPKELSYNLFYLFHPMHVFFSAFVTVSMYRIYNKKASVLKVFLIGVLGSIGIATLSDSLIPYFGETLLKLPCAHAHIGFIEKWYLINPMAFAGMVLAFFIPSTKFPHFGHVFLSMWASLAHIMMAVGIVESFSLYVALLLFLFLAVWVPCCVSDIVFPLLFIKKRRK